MNKKRHAARADRREFLQAAATIGASAVLLGFGASCSDDGGSSEGSSSGTGGAPGAGGTPDPGNGIGSITLNNGIAMPILGFGTLGLDDAVGEQSVATAISLGYRLIDTARIYGNEAAVGRGITASGINREELFVTSKLWVSEAGYESAKQAYETTLSTMGLDYLDLYLIHRPRGDVAGSWRAMEELLAEGRVRAIGVSNFEPAQVTDLITNNTIKPAINQIEAHPFFQQPLAHEALVAAGVQMEGWAPFAEGRNGMFTNPTLASVGDKYGKTNAQVALRWAHQRGIIAIPRTSQEAHMIENLNIFDFQLDETDMMAIVGLDLDVTQFPEWE